MGATSAHPTPARGYKLTISLGLVNVGVKYAPIVRDERIRGKYLDPTTLTPVHQQYVNDDGAVVEDKVTGYPHAGGDDFIVLSPGDVKALESERDTRLELKAALELDVIDPLYFEKTYLVWPDKGHEEGYDLICAVLASTGQVLVGTAVLSKSTKVIVLRYGQGCLMAHACTYDDYVTWGDHSLVTKGHGERPAPSDELLAMAHTLLGNLPSEFDMAGVHNEYDQRLRAAIAEVAAGRPVPVQETADALPVSDLMEALKASVEGAAASQDAEKPKRRTKAKAKA